MSYSSEVLADAPVAYWRLGTGSTDVDDASGNGHTLSKTGSPVEVAGLLVSNTTDGARALPGTNGAYYEATDHDDFDFLNTAAFSVEAWISCKSVDANFDRAVGHEDATNGYTLGAHSTSGLFFNRLAGGAGNLMTHVPPQGVLVGVTYHLVGTYDGAEMRFYVNGVLRDGPDAVATNLGAVGNTVRTGPFTGSAQLDGVVDEIAIYSSALSAARIATHYAAGTASERIDYSRFPKIKLRPLSQQQGVAV